MQKYYDVRVLAPIVGAVAAWFFASWGLYHSVGYMTLTGQYTQSPSTQLWYIGLLAASYLAGQVMLLQYYHWPLSSSAQHFMAFSYATSVTLLANWDALHDGSYYWFVVLFAALFLSQLHDFGTWLSGLYSQMRIPDYA